MKNGLQSLIIGAGLITSAIGIPNAIYHISQRMSYEKNSSLYAQDQAKLERVKTVDWPGLTLGGFIVCSSTMFYGFPQAKQI